MTALSVQPPFPTITDIDGQPLEDGYIWIGVANLPPIGNPIAVYWDAALTQPAALPVRTRGGYPVNAGTPARLYVNSDYSIQVQNRNGSVVYSAPQATERYGALIISSADISFLQAGSGAVVRTAQSKMRETVSVKDFGVVGDGVTDDTVAFQAAVNAAEGQTLFVPEGSYKLGPIQLKSNSIYDFTKAIFYPATGTGDLYLFELNAKTNVYINGGTISVASYTPLGSYSPPYSTVGTNWPNGYFYGGTAIQIQNGCTYVTVENTRFEGCLGGVNIYDSSFCSVKNTTHYNGLAGIAIVCTVNGSEIVGIQVTDNMIIGCGDDGVAVLCNNPTGNSNIYSCTVSRNYIDKLRLFASATASAVGIRTGYWATPAGGTGSVRSCVISNNTMRAMVQEGMFIQQTFLSTICNNTVQNYSALSTTGAYTFGSSGSAATASSKIIFSNNSCANPSVGGLGLDVNFVEYSSFSGNHIDANSGFYAFGGVENKYNVISGNTFGNPSGPAIRLSTGSDYNAIVGNNFAATNSPYLVYTGDNNVISANGEIPRLTQIDVAANSTIVPNVALESYVWVRCVSTVTAITIDNPIGPIYNGQELVFSIRNQTTGNLTVSWGAALKLASWGALATGFTRSITYQYNNITSTWVEISRSGDIPN